MKLLSLFILAVFALVQEVSAADVHHDQQHHRMLNETITVISETEADAEVYLGCDQVASGDVFIYHVESMDKKEAVKFMALDDLPGNLHLYITDFPWDGETYLDSTSQVGDTAMGDSGEGILMFITPEEGIKAGEKFEYSGDTEEDWSEIEGSYDLAITGDSVFMYCMLNNETYKNIVGLSFDSQWSEPGLTVEDYGTDSTSQPKDLTTVGSVILEHFSGYHYIGEGLENYTVSLKATMQENMLEQANWEGGGYSSVGTRELFTTAVLALGGFVVMAL